MGTALSKVCAAFLVRVCRREQNPLGIELKKEDLTELMTSDIVLLRHCSIHSTNVFEVLLCSIKNTSH